jgi:hypothetical protein
MSDDGRSRINVLSIDLQRRQSQYMLVFSVDKVTYFQSYILGGCIYRKRRFGVLVDKENVFGSFFVQM